MRCTHKLEDKYTADYFIDKFKKIPSKNWCDGALSKGVKRCALGHCGFTDKEITEESAALMELVETVLDTSVAMINDFSEWDQNFHLPYLKHIKSPKKRVLAALKLIKKMEST